jgi:hypothetical protein
MLWPTTQPRFSIPAKPFNQKQFTYVDRYTEREREEKRGAREQVYYAYMPKLTFAEVRSGRQTLTCMLFHTY